MKFKLSLLIWALVMAIVVAMWVTAKPSSTQSVAASTPVMAKVATTAAAAPAKPYPFATSVVSGQKLGGPGTGVTLDQNGYEVKLTNQTEADTFKQNPAPYLSKIEDAYKNAKPCPLTVCPVMGDALDKDAYVFVYEGREFKLCCDSCLEDFQKDPDKFVKIWDAAAQAAPSDKK
jgi:YHS domain-containing protein